MKALSIKHKVLGCLEGVFAQGQVYVLVLLASLLIFCVGIHNDSKERMYGLYKYSETRSLASPIHRISSLLDCHPRTCLKLSNWLGGKQASMSTNVSAELFVSPTSGRTPAVKTSRRRNALRPNGYPSEPYRKNFETLMNALTLNPWRPL